MKSRFALTALVAIAAVATAGCSSPPDTSGIVATNVVLASIVQEVVGERFRVDSVIPDGKDPHEFQPSAGDIARIANARIVISNGYGYEPTLKKALAAARADGVTVFDVERNFSAINDPHWFTDPLAAADVMARLVPVLEKATGTDLDGSAAAATTEFRGIVEEGQRRIASVPAGTCEFATEHIFLGPFGDRFGCHGSTILIQGSRVPDAEPSAADIERFIADIRTRRIKVLMEDASEPSRILDRVAESSGARVIPVNVHGLGQSRTYRSYVLAIVDALVGALR